MKINSYADAPSNDTDIMYTYKSRILGLRYTKYTWADSICLDATKLILKNFCLENTGDI